MIPLKGCTVFGFGVTNQVKRFFHGAQIFSKKTPENALLLSGDAIFLDLDKRE